MSKIKVACFFLGHGVLGLHLPGGPKK